MLYRTKVQPVFPQLSRRKNRSTSWIQKEVLKHPCRKSVFALVPCLFARGSLPFSLPWPPLASLHHSSPGIGVKEGGLATQPLWNPSMAIISILWGNKGTHLWRWWWGADRRTGGKERGGLPGEAEGLTTDTWSSLIRRFGESQLRDQYLHV